MQAHIVNLSKSIASSVVLWSFGDGLSQSIRNRNNPLPPESDQAFVDQVRTSIARINWQQNASMALFGGLMNAPYFYMGWTALDRVMGISRNLRQSMGKAIVNQILLSPPYLCTVLAFPGIQRGDTSDQILDTVHHKFLDLYMPAWCIWPAVNAFTFARVPPGWKRLAFSNAVGVVWVAYVSSIQAANVKMPTQLVDSMQSSSDTKIQVNNWAAAAYPGSREGRIGIGKLDC
ncbi:hypothetical protein SeMB42_g02673 [Synchytrium endobioticum]|uniref:Protein Mpv17 n=1 Tax=Synchytrium endobioticum TaxID=286115 RepID=A0A507DDE5_9FUNG|nr:hypothetical protein SeLEV6574_g02115 [Synchytrium endobioticum]TPX49277.1 hypothetical protein SeMB42_g02673 [Synchytrium endobioticum]